MYETARALKAVVFVFISKIIMSKLYEYSYIAQKSAKT